jgi:hypothetical protein
MSGALASVMVGGRFSGALVIGTNGLGDYGFISGSFGSLTPSTYASNTITRLLWVDSTDTLTMRMTTNPADSNSTFISLLVNGTIYARASASFSTSGSESVWTWSGLSSNIIGTSGTISASLL